MLKTSSLRPGLLVSLKTSVVGNVTYRKVDLEKVRSEDGSYHSRWETERRIADEKEYNAANSARANARAVITSKCITSAFGSLCPESSAPRLEAAIAEAHEITSKFNAQAKITRVSVFVITGRIAADDVEAVRAINSEVRDLLTEMERGLQNLDARAVREASDKAKRLGSMLSLEASARVRSAVDAARGAARRITKAGEQAAIEIDEYAIRAITESRTAFLDLGEADEVQVPMETGRMLDLETETEEEVAEQKFQESERYAAERQETAIKDEVELTDK